MAQQYQSPAAYGGQYAQMQYYPQFNAQPQQQAQSPGLNQHAHAQNIHTHAAGSNARRFEANTHVPTPPIPFQLPPNFNPDILKQLANSNLPPPPPPPPLPMPFSSASFPPVPYPAFHAPNGAATPPTEYHPSSQDHVQLHNTQQHYATPMLQSFQPPQSSSPSANAHHAQNQPTYTSTAEPSHTLESTTANKHLSPLNQQQFEQDRSSGTVPAAPADGPRRDALQVSSQPNLSPESRRYDARQAILELAQAGISFENVIREGINPDLVRRLFEELGLRASVAVDTTNPSNVDTGSKMPRPGSGEKSRKLEPETTDAHSEGQAVTTNPALSSDVASAAMERKDRIAKLLAAKRGQVSSNPSSASASPAPPEPKTLVASVAPKAIVTENVAPTLPSNLSLSFGTNDTSREVSQVAQSPVVAITSKPELPESTLFSIPGLFMNSADDIEEDQARDVETATSSAVEQATLSSHHASLEMVTEPQISLKRKSDAELEMSPTPKRQLSHDVIVRQDANDDIMFTMSQTGSVSAAPVSTPPAKLPESSAHLHKPAEVPAPGSRPKVNQEKLTARMAALKADLLRRNSRQKALQDGMPALDAELQNLRDRLSQQEQSLGGIRQQIQSREKELIEIKFEEKTILQQISDLRQQLAAGESGQQQFSTELTQLNSQITRQQQETEAVRDSLAHDIVTSTDSTGEESHRSAAATPQTSGGGDIIMSEDVKVQDGSVLDQAQVDRQFSPRAEEMWNAVNPITQDLVTGDDRANNIIGTPDVIPETTDKPISLNQDSDASSDGSASMSDSGSEDYEPAGAVDYDNAAEDVTMEDEGEYDPEALEDTKPQSDSVVDDDDHGEYEPADVIDANDTAQDAAISDLEAQIVTPTEVPTTEQVADPEASRQSSVPEASQRGLELDTPTNHSTEYVVDGIHLDPLGAESDPVRKRYVPYNSPLTSLKSFRFHPQYNEVVKDGYRSLTYSNQIDPKAPICPTELSGETCTDPDCSEQHFGSMALSDDKILVQMSSANDIKDKAQRDAYLIGLKKVIADLRERGVKEFSEVANELSKYRRDWTLAQAEAAS